MNNDSEKQKNKRDFENQEFMSHLFLLGQIWFISAINYLFLIYMAYLDLKTSFKK